MRELAERQETLDEDASLFVERHGLARPDLTPDAGLQAGRLEGASRKARGEPAKSIRSSITR